MERHAVPRNADDQSLPSGLDPERPCGRRDQRLQLWTDGEHGSKRNQEWDTAVKGLKISGEDRRP
jgi:hypothetical protein